MTPTVLPAAVDIREVAPRDGLQIEDPIPTTAKVELLAALAATGVRRIEATAFVSPRAVPSMADAEAVAAALADLPALEWSALVAGVGGARRAVAAGMRTVEYVVSAADGHSLANARRTTDEAVAAVAEVADVVHAAGGRCEVIIATAWDCPFDGATPVERVAAIAARAVQLGVPLGVHYHNTRGTGIANAYAAILAGVTQLDASAGGMGGCPFAPGASGNIATEELVYLLDDAGVRTGVDLDATLTAARLAQGFVGHALDSNLLRAGGRSRPRPRPEASL
jgi:hydroxymethylglutaryl-CoA lyase